MTVAHGAFPIHGGRLSEMSRRYGIERRQWLDLSTGINPCAYPITPINASACQALPDQDQALHEAAARYYLGQSPGADDNCLPESLTLLNVPGSQWAIEHLPQSLESGTVALPDIGYREHEWGWQRAGHHALLYDADRPETVIEKASDTNDLRAMIIINPNNPGGQHFSPRTLRALAAELQHKNAVMIVDEAFADATPEQSLLPDIADNVIVLRSLGKFFGLAGLRLGTVVGRAQSAVMKHLSSLQGPWQVASPTQQAGMEAFSDDLWQRHMRGWLQRASQQQGQWLEKQLKPHGDIIRWRQSALFNGFEMPLERASQWHEAFLPLGILTRLWLIDEQRAIVRFGLHDECAAAVHHLEQAMTAAQKTMEKRS